MINVVSDLTNTHRIAASQGGGDGILQFALSAGADREQEAGITVPTPDHTQSLFELPTLDH